MFWKTLMNISTVLTHFHGALSGTLSCIIYYTSVTIVFQFFIASYAITV